MAGVLERVRKIIADQLAVKEEAVVPEAFFVEDLEADSIDIVRLIEALEETFSTADKTLRISDQDAENILSVQDLVSYIEAKGF